MLTQCGLLDKCMKSMPLMMQIREAMLPELYVLPVHAGIQCMHAWTPGLPVRCGSQMPDLAPPKLCSSAQHSGSPALAQAGPTKICQLSALWEDSGSTAQGSLLSTPDLAGSMES